MFYERAKMMLSMADTNHVEKGMVLSGDNDTLVYTRNERKPRSSKGKRGRLPGTREEQKVTKEME